MDDPFPDLHELFRLYSSIYFSQPADCLDRCMVEWSSKRMTLCGGTCQYLGHSGGCIIKLSEPLLKVTYVLDDHPSPSPKLCLAGMLRMRSGLLSCADVICLVTQFRPVKDLKETLLHEMIHAYMFLTGTRGTGSDGHGPPFVAKMTEINTSTAFDPMRPPEGYNVAVHHTWSAEVEAYRTHHWKCERCDDVVKRSMNRPPQEADCRGRQGRGTDCADPHCRYHMHKKTCGGTFVKVAEPEGYGAKSTKAKAAEKKRAPSAAEPLNSIKKFMKPTNAGSTSAEPPADAVTGTPSGEALTGEAPAALTPIQPNQDAMRRLLADAALRRIQRPRSAATDSSRTSVQTSSTEPSEPRAVEPEVIVVSDSD